MSEEENNTVFTLETLTKLILDMRKEFKERMDKLETKVDGIDTNLEDVRHRVMSLEVRLERVEASIHETISVSNNAVAVAKNVRADVMVLREELRSWTKDVMLLQEKVL